VANTTADPLRRAKALADAAELGVALSSPELAEVLGMSPATFLIISI